jgi:hypothetical protein
MHRRAYNPVRAVIAIIAGLAFAWHQTYVPIHLIAHSHSDSIASPAEILIHAHFQGDKHEHIHMPYHAQQPVAHVDENESDYEHEHEHETVHQHEAVHEPFAAHEHDVVQERDIAYASGHKHEHEFDHHDHFADHHGDHYADHNGEHESEEPESHPADHDPDHESTHHQDDRSGHKRHSAHDHMSVFYSVQNTPPVVETAFVYHLYSAAHYADVILPGTVPLRPGRSPPPFLSLQNV